HQQPHGADGCDLGAGKPDPALRHHHRHRQRLCKERRHRMDPCLEAQGLAHRRRAAGEERRPLAAAGRGAGPAPGDLALDQGPCGARRERTRRCAGPGRDGALQEGRRPMTPETVLQILDYAAVAVFAVTGALAASRSQLDIVGFIFIACLTATGGGTTRDVILDRTVFWVADPVVLAVATAAAVAVFLTAHLLESRYRADRKSTRLN